MQFVQNGANTPEAIVQSLPRVFAELIVIFVLFSSSSSSFLL